MSAGPVGAARAGSTLRSGNGSESPVTAARTEEDFPGTRTQRWGGTR
jgi:hypothetical protein